MKYKDSILICFNDEGGADVFYCGSPLGVFKNNLFHPKDINTLVNKEQLLNDTELVVCSIQTEIAVGKNQKTP